MSRAQGASRELGRRLGEYAKILAHSTVAQLYSTVGRSEQALHHHAYLIRNVGQIRESITPYRKIDTLISRFSELKRHKHEAQYPEKCVFFVGYSRSGHSLVGSLLDAHPHIVISHELHALSLLRAGANFEEMVKAIRYNAYFFNYFGRSYTGYDYQVAGQFQGRCTRLQILGDKKGNGTTRLLRAHPEIIELLERELPVPCQFIHVIRNPYDNIATKSLRRGYSLRSACQRYFANAQTIRDLKERYQEDVIDIYLDDLIARPEETLRALLQVLGVTEIPAGYIEACKSILFSTPSRSRDKVIWDDTLISHVQERMAEFPFLSRFFDASHGPRGAQGDV